LRKTALVSIALICLVAFSVIYGIATIPIYNADNGRPYSTQPVEPLDNGRPYSILPVEPLDNGRPY